MSDIRILFLSMDRDKKVANHFDDFRDVFCKYADVTVIKQNFITDKKKYVSIIPKTLDYDCIICDSLFLWMYDDWSRVKIPTFSIIEDQHNPEPKKMIDFAIKNDHIIVHRYRFNKFHKDIPKLIETFWSPHSVNINTFRNWELPKEYGVMLSGAMHAVYQTRHKVLRQLKNQKFFKHLQRPADYSKNPWPVGSDYSKELNKAWLSVCCGATVQYPVMKFFEIPASGSVLYSDYFPELGDLGFVPDENMIKIDHNNIRKQVTELLKDKSKLTKIIKSSYDLIHSRHTNDIRARELLSFIETVV